MEGLQRLWEPPPKDEPHIRINYDFLVLPGLESDVQLAIAITPGIRALMYRKHAPDTAITNSCLPACLPGHRSSAPFGPLLVIRRF